MAQDQELPGPRAVTPSAATPPVTTEPARRASPLLLVVVWAVVGLPALWGVSQTLRTAFKLFAPPPAKAAPATTAPGNGQPSTSHAP